MLTWNTIRRKISYINITLLTSNYSYCNKRPSYSNASEFKWRTYQITYIHSCMCELKLHQTYEAAAQCKLPAYRIAFAERPRTSRIRHNTQRGDFMVKFNWSYNLFAFSYLTISHLQIFYTLDCERVELAFTGIAPSHEHKQRVVIHSVNGWNPTAAS